MHGKAWWSPLTTPVVNKGIVTIDLRVIINPSLSKETMSCFNLRRQTRSCRLLGTRYPSCWWPPWGQWTRNCGQQQRCERRISRTPVTKCNILTKSSRIPPPTLPERNFVPKVLSYALAWLALITDPYPTSELTILWSSLVNRKPDTFQTQDSCQIRRSGIANLRLQRRKRDFVLLWFRPNCYAI